MVTGYDSGTALVTAATLSALTQTILGICTSAISSGNPGNIVTKGIFTSTLNGTAQAIGDAVYANSSGDPSFTVSQRRIGTLLTTTTNAVVLIDIKQENLDYFSTALAIPSGVVFPYTAAIAPAGFLICNGASYLTATHPNLFAVTGYTYGGSGANFNVPDYRGMFLRGTGTHGTLQTANATAFSGPVIGASQLDMAQGHFHDVLTSDTNLPMYYNGGVMGSGAQASVNENVAAAQLIAQDPTTDTVNGIPRTGSETRPVNIGVQYIIKT